MTRSFETDVGSHEMLALAVSAHATWLAEKLARLGLATDYVTVFIETSKHNRTTFKVHA